MSGLTATVMTLYRFSPCLKKSFSCWTASANSPAVILLEDLDRAFPRSGGSSSKISMQTLLNCLHGISTAPGVITIATANEPSLLDPAILRRPGRFDRVILFGPPSPELRQEYLEKIHASMAEYDLGPVVLETEGFSYALLQECYILAAQSAREADRALTVEDMVESAVAKKSDASGFAPSGGGLRSA